MIYLRRLLIWFALGPRAYREMVRDMKSSVGDRGFVEVKTIRGHRVLVSNWKRTLYEIVSGREFI
jgi:hypothetical protein